MITARDLTLHFIVEPPEYQMMACHLAASARMHLPAEVTLIGYCPAHRMEELDPDAEEVLRRLRVEVRPIETAGRFEPVYPHGNKLLAVLEPKPTRFAAFLDSDMLFVRDCDPAQLCAEGAVGVVPSTSMRWAGQQIWGPVYGAFGLDVPEERITMTRDKRMQVAPYFNAGLIVVDEGYRDAEGRRFAEVWMETAQRLDALRDLPGKRPYLDQMSLPVAIRRAGLAWNLLPERFNYSVGGILRGKTVDPDRDDITLLHYRRARILSECGMREHARAALAQEAGTRRINWIFLNDPKPGIPKLEEVDPEKAARVQARKAAEAAAKAAPPPEPAAPPPAPAEAAAPAPAEGPGRDPSKADLAVVTMVHDDHAFLRRWVDHYGGEVGRENLYILRHGADPEIDRIAEGANVLHVPNPPDKTGFDRRRWAALSQIASGLTLYYNWVLCGDVDELVVLDPAAGTGLARHLLERLDRPGAPQVVIPLGLEVVHLPEDEPAPLDPARPVLDQRRNLRVHSNYAKPCLIRRRAAFSVGGHGIAIDGAEVDEALLLFHLRYMDDGLSRARLDARARFAEAKNGPEAEDSEGIASAWSRSAAEFERLRALPRAVEEVDLSEIARRLTKNRTQADSGNWFPGRWVSKDLKRLPDRFKGLI